MGACPSVFTCKLRNVNPGVTVDMRSNDGYGHKSRKGVGGKVICLLSRCGFEIQCEQIWISTALV